MKPIKNEKLNALDTDYYDSIIDTQGINTNASTEIRIDDSIWNELEDDVYSLIKDSLI